MTEFDRDGTTENMFKNRLTPEERLWMRATGDVLRQIRREKGSSLEEAAAAARMNRTRLADLESGRYDPPEGYDLMKLAAVYDKPCRKMFAWIERLAHLLLEP